MYQRCMAVAFVTNGLGAYGLRVLAGAGLGGVDETQYLAIWYLAGSILALTVALRYMGKPAAKEFGIGMLMALCSVLGQTGMALAMSGGIPGYVVFPVAVGGGLILVVMVGVFAFRERVSPLLALGVASGLASLILLALPS
jgi:multidrug transporter EmrE-like cation transporter